ncbi:GNAT family N-acetyltransferase [Actinospica sp. MGRD01-02]|uniref:GNAT family N-acetyltransferase n=1 Tax=Actinospica acidithermotolerans TaxID=2828514 RepID=A0A941EGP1_9ACTN|nr:GNAT family N-acetyltransferase [Actinospica acidithermotolerans]MBR7830961.1 GNAT family N-acetyltransferase [Actinospica acidithermotolerans]
MRTLFAPASGPVQRSWRLTRVQTASCGGGAEPEVPAELLAQIQVCQNAADLADRPGDPPASRAELRSLLAPPFRGRRFVHLAHDHYGRLLGFARLGVYSAFHRELAHGALTVHPAARRHGVGSALLGALAASARANGRARLVLDGPRNAATDGFARSWGLIVGSCDLRSRLDLNSAALHARLGGIVPLQRDIPDGNLLPMRWAGACPEYLLDALIETLDSLHADPDDPAVTPFTEAEVRHREQAAWSAGLREYTACLLDPATGRMAALSTAHTADGVRGEQNETVVVPEYRGRGLAIRVKAYLVHELLAAEPNLRVLDTYNAVGNARILAVNRSLGFEPVDTHAAWTMAL